MTRWVPSLVAIASAFALSAAFFVASAAAVPLRDQTGLIVVWCVACVVAVAFAARRLGPLYGVPLAIAAGLGLDAFYIPPPRTLNWENVLVIATYLGLGVLVGALAEATRRQRGRLADEQAALRRVATLVARGVEPSEVFGAAAVEMRDLLGAGMTRIARFESDATATLVAETGDAGERGARWELRPPSAAWEVFRTGRIARAGDSVAAPVVVGGRLWGAIVVSSESGPLPDGTEHRMGEFTELLAIAIANADGRAKLTASRARIVAAGDQSRRRVERDLHDGVQQRLVSLTLALRRAAKRVPAELPELRDVVSQTAEGLNEATEELREIARGIHPAILTQGGLAPALRTLARRSAVPVEVTVENEQRLPEHVEVAAYYVVAEALANAVRHASASSVSIDVARDDGSLRVHVRDDGIGGADPDRGSGLIGLRDRVEALGGSIAVESPPGRGTSLEVVLPVAPGG